MKKILVCSILLFLNMACSDNKEELDQIPQNTSLVSFGTVPTITEQDINNRISLLTVKDAEFAQTPMGKQNLLQAITREKLILKDATENNLHTTEEYLALLRAKKELLDSIFQEYAEQTLENLWYEHQQQIGSLAVSEEEIKDYYKKYNYEMLVKQIIVADATTAEQLLRTLKSSPSHWKELSKKHNIAPDYLRKEPFAFMPGEFFSNIEDAVANSANNSVQGFIKTPLGFHIIMKMGEKHLSKEDAEPRIRTILENQKLDKVLSSLKNKYEVMIYDTNK